jgi:hypothetical protein
LDEERIREKRLRQMAARRGFLLRKSRSRDPEARDYGRYALVSNSQGARHRGVSYGGYDLTLDDVERELADLRPYC